MNFEEKYYKYKLKYLKLKASLDLNEQFGGFTAAELEDAKKRLKKTKVGEPQIHRTSPIPPPPPPPPMPTTSPVANIPPATTTQPTSTKTVTNVYHYVPVTQTRLLYPTYSPSKIYYDLDTDLSLDEYKPRRKSRRKSSKKKRTSKRRTSRKTSKRRSSRRASKKSSKRRSRK